MSLRPLDNIVVLDLSRVLAGPFCSMNLADMGAEVIKVEEPGKGDDTRSFGPPFINGESGYFLSLNRNKESITLDLKNPEAKEIIYSLAAESDVLLENFRPGTAEKLGFSYERISGINPRIIYCSVSGFGQTGPESRRPGYDLVIQGMSGIMSLTGDPAGTPYKMGVSIADLVAGLYAVQGILLALYARERTGKGQRVDVSLLDGQISLLTFQAGICFAGACPMRKGNRHPNISPYETFGAKDGYFNLAVGSEKIWLEFCALIGMQRLAEDPRFARNPDRVKNRDELFAILSELFKDRTVSEWIKIFDNAGIPAGPILSVEEALAHPQVLSREMVHHYDHPIAGAIATLGIPPKLSETPGAITTPPPVLGQHTAKVLKERLGFSDEKIAALKARGVT